MKLKILVLSIFLAGFTQQIFSQANCSAPATGYVPINDLGTNISPITGLKGGLYPNGSNNMPQAHKSAGLQLASQVQCLGASGNPDAVSGKIVWLSIGMSNCTMESQQFILQAQGQAGINPKLVLVNGAKGGQNANLISNPSDPGYQAYWDTVVVRLSNAGVTANQVQVVWFQDANPAGTTPAQIYHDTLVVQFKRIMNELKNRFPKIKICYVGSRISGRYASVALNPEPYAYWQGWAIKKVIEDQINGDAQLQYSGAGAKSPFISWSAYTWSDGSTPQTTNPNVFFTCPADFIADGTHPSVAGAQKVGALLLNFFTSDSTATPWFLGNGCNLTAIPETSAPSQIKIFPNPFSSHAVLQSNETLENATLTIYNSLGQTVKQLINISGQETALQRADLPSGLYFMRLTEAGNLIATDKLAITD